MRKAIPITALLLCLLLCACSSAKTEKAAEDIQSVYSSANSVKMDVSVTADYGDKTYVYKLACAVSPEGGEIEIREPESIAGVKAAISEDGVTLCYDGAEVYTGALLPDGLSPADAIPVMVSAWREGLVTESVKESFGDVPCYALVFRIDDDVSLRTWFSEETYLPVHAEFSLEEYTVILCDVENAILE